MKRLVYSYQQAHNKDATFGKRSLSELGMQGYYFLGLADQDEDGVEVVAYTDVLKEGARSLFADAADIVEVEEERVVGLVMHNSEGAKKYIAMNKDSWAQWGYRPD